MNIFLALGNPILMGLSLAVLGISGEQALKQGWLRISLATGLGVAMISGLHFLWTIAFGPDTAVGAYLVIETSLAVGLAVVAVWKVRKDRPWMIWNRPRWPGWGAAWPLLIAGGIFFLLFVSFLSAWYGQTIQHPHGHWDAWSIWNLRARFLYSGESWRNGFDPALGWSHTGYPLLLPQFIARTWILVGSRSLWVPAGIGLLFSLSIVAMIVFEVARLRSWLEGLTAGCFAVIAVSAGLDFLQYADLPLAFYLCAASIFLLQQSPEKPDSSSLWLNGFALGAAAWTKNEGWVWFGVVWVVECLRWILARQKPSKCVIQAGWIGLGMLPLLLVLGLFKTQIASLDPLLERQTMTLLVERVVDVSRYPMVALAFLRQIVSGTHYLLPLLAAYLIVVGISKQKSGWAGWLRVLLMSTAYFGIYLVTPSPLAWQLETSLNRLFAQLLPMVILMVFWTGGSLSVSRTSPFEREDWADRTEGR